LASITASSISSMNNRQYLSDAENPNGYRWHSTTGIAYHA
jgi:hypothetical protein